MFYLHKVKCFSEKKDYICTNFSLKIMLNRRILRIKVFKTLYSCAISRDSNCSVSLAEATKSLEESCESTRDLYLFMLGIISPLAALSAERIEAAKHKAHLTEEDLNPNTKFADNALARLLDEDIDFQKFLSKKKFSWDQYDLFLKKTLSSITSKTYYKNYMTSGKSSLEEDCRLFTKIFEEEFVDSEDLEQILEDMSIYWNDDLAYALTYCCKTFSSLAKGEKWNLYPLYQSDILAASGKTNNLESDKAFATKLLQHSYAGYSDWSSMVAEAVTGWEKDRLVTTDICLIVCCLAEIVNFPNIPVNVSLNEYVEISKFYGTPKSSVFVNGILDRLVVKLREEGKINKN